MRSVDSAIVTALGARQLKARNFVWVADLTGAHTLGIWDDVGTVTASYIDITTGNTLSRSYTGAGGLLSVDSIVLMNDITIRNINIELSNLDSNVINLVRTYNMRGATIEIHRGLFTIGTEILVAPLTPRFAGFMDSLEIIDPSEGQNGSVKVTAVSHTRALTRTNTDTSSNESQKLRLSTDTFFKDVGVVSSWQVFWGTNKGTVTDNQVIPQDNTFDQNFS
jgi:hypothetical protein